MEIKKQSINGYDYIIITLNSKEDGGIINRIKEKAKEDADKVNKKSQAGIIRTQELINYNNLGGVLAQEMVIIHLKEEAKKNKIDAKIYSPPFTGHLEHRDIKVEINGKVKTIEVRSSFQYKQPNLRKVVKEVFSLIGPYTTSYKGGEPKKDFYIQVLHRYENPEIIRRIDNKIEVFIIGGGSEYLFNKLGKKEFLKQEGAEYLVIKPINQTKGINALTKEILGIKKEDIIKTKQKKLF